MVAALAVSACLPTPGATFGRVRQRSARRYLECADESRDTPVARTSRCREVTASITYQADRVRQYWPCLVAFRLHS